MTKVKFEFFPELPKAQDIDPVDEFFKKDSFNQEHFLKNILSELMVSDRDLFPAKDSEVLNVRKQIRQYTMSVIRETRFRVTEIISEGLADLKNSDI